MKKIILALVSLFAATGAAHAQIGAAPSPSPVRFMAGLGFSAGGDDLATARYDNGTSQDIKAGGGVYFTAGVDYRIAPQFSVQASASFHVDDTDARNGSIKFQRFPLELIAYYQPHPQWRVGGGVRYVSGAKITSSGAASGIDVKFDDTTSAVVEAEYFYSPNFGIKLRYVNETYKSPGYYDFKANHVGISGNFYF